MNHSMMNMFATPLYKSALGRRFTEEEVKCFQRELGDAVFSMSNHSSRNKYVLNNPALRDIRGVIEANLAQYFTTVFNTSNKAQLQITQSWLTSSRKGEAHHTHTHPNSVASGVLYISLAQEDGISFYRNDDMLWHDLIPAEENYYNARRYFINTSVGDLLIFPSGIRHGVRPVTEDIERVSLSFNTFFSGELGREEFSTSLKLSVS